MARRRLKKARKRSDVPGNHPRRRRVTLEDRETGERYEARLALEVRSATMKGWRVLSVEVDHELWTMLQVSPEGETNHRRWRIVEEGRVNPG